MSKQIIDERGNMLEKIATIPNWNATYINSSTISRSASAYT